ncbi:MAG TPA: phage tail assembly chaperone [Methylobacterium sp.]|nr:phage tail assembly chaperone [Methylobacterium sp.]
MRWPPPAFWAATPRELARAAGAGRPRDALGPADLARLLAAFPDA